MTGLEGRAADRLRAFFRLKERGFCVVFLPFWLLRCVIAVYAEKFHFPEI